MVSTVYQHRVFYGGIEERKKYFAAKGADFSSGEIVRIMESFQERYLYSSQG